MLGLKLNHVSKRGNMGNIGQLETMEKHSEYISANSYVPSNL